MSDLWSEFRKAADQLRGQILTGRFILAIVICPLIGLGLLVAGIKEKGLARLTFGDVWPAIAITLAGGVYVLLYRFLTRPEPPDDEAPVPGDQVPPSPPSTQP